MCVWVYIYKSRLTTTSQPLSNYFIINCKLQSIYDDQKMLQPYNEIINSRNMTWMRAHEWIEIFLKFLKKKSLNISSWWQKKVTIFSPIHELRVELSVYFKFIFVLVVLLLVRSVVCCWKSERVIITNSKLREFHCELDLK